MITETGYHRSTFEEILSDLTLKAQELFGEDIDVSEQTPLGKLLNIMAYVRAKDNENAEMIYYSRFPNTANGTSLDRLCPFVGVTRNVATPARYEVTVIGEEGTTIPLEFLVSTESGIEFYNIADTTIETGQTTCTITVECTQAGIIGNVLPADIVEIVNPEAGIDSIVGIKQIAVGADEESDYELRKRMLVVGEGMGSCNTSAIRAALLKIPTVTSATVVENDTDTTDSLGNVPHSIACYVAGGDDYKAEIAEAIFNSKPSGIKTNGSISIDVLDAGGYTHTVKFNTMQSVNVSVAIEVDTSVYFEGESGIDEIKRNVAAYINELGFGNDVILSAIYGYIYSVKGVSRVTSLKLSTDGATFTADDISISNLQCAACESVSVSEV